MPQLPWLKIAGGVAGLVALLFAVNAARAWWADHKHAQAEAEVLADCELLAAGKPAQGLCRPLVREAVVDAVKARACRDGLQAGATPLDPWSVPLVCVQPVQDLAKAHAERAGEVASRDGELANLRGGQAAALNRLATRVEAQAKRTADAAETIRALPSRPDGRRVCDFECLSRVTP